MNLKKLFIGIFCCIIMCPMCLQGIYGLTSKRLDLVLNGYSKEEEKPCLTVSDYFSGAYQSQYDKWLNANLIPRGCIIKSYNQLRYSCFSLGNRIVGRSGNVFESHYIKDALTIGSYNYSITENRVLLENYVQHLKNIQEKLHNAGKFFLIYTTPSKAAYNLDDIPFQYRIQDEHGVRGIVYLQQLLSNQPINYFDTSDAAPDGYPLFYKTGIHWARPVEQQASLALINKLSDISGKQLRKFAIQDIKISSQPFWRDSDVYNLLNIFSDSPDQAYYEYNTAAAYPDYYDRTRILLQGSSFSEGFQKDFFERYPNEEVSYINYNNYIRDPAGNIKTLTQWEDLDLKYYLDRTDFVVIELNEAMIHSYSSGFVEYLDSYLDTYVPSSGVLGEMGINLCAAEKTGLESSRGYYDYEDACVWTKENCSVTLQNEGITSQGLLFEIGIHEESVKNGDFQLTVYVNHNKCQELTFTQPGNFDFVIPPESLGRSSNDIYEIELFCSGSFNPAAAGIKNDTRDLGIMVYYIGEEK